MKTATFSLTMFAYMVALVAVLSMVGCATPWSDAREQLTPVEYLGTVVQTVEELAHTTARTREQNLISESVKHDVLDELQAALDVAHDGHMLLTLKPDADVFDEAETASDYINAVRAILIRHGAEVGAQEPLIR